MQIIQNQSLSFQDFISKQKIDDGISWRLSKYCLIHEIKEGILCYNTLSCELLFLNKEEYDNVLNNNYLKEHWFVVPTGFDERKLLNQLRKLLSLIEPVSHDLYNYTILTTTDCNARCFYCYEQGIRKLRMNESTAEKIAQFIINNYKKQKGQPKPISICWFGGEPLYNYKVIDIICELLRKESVAFSSNMISNGLLFSPKIIEKAHKQWNLRNVQITIDGTEDVYNKTKDYINCHVSAYQHVIKNISSLLSIGIYVVVRLNIGSHNTKDIELLIDDLYANYKGQKGFSCYCTALHDNLIEQSKLHTYGDTEDLYKHVNQYNNRLRDLHFFRPYGLRQDIPTNSCMADDNHSAVISPLGNLGKCEHYADRDFYSHIDTPDCINTEMFDSFKEAHEDTPLCDTCEYYPQCIRLKKCSGTSECIEIIKEFRLSKIKSAMEDRYYGKISNGEINEIC